MDDTVALVLIIALVLICVTLLLCVVILSYELSSVCDELSGIHCGLIELSSLSARDSIAKLNAEVCKISWSLNDIGCHIDTLGDILKDGDTNGD